jgi:DNA-binding NarL/FixJ family response regulator
MGMAALARVTPMKQRVDKPAFGPRVDQPTARIAIVDDEPISRGGLEQLAGAVPGMSVTASVSSIAELDEDGGYDLTMLHVPAREGELSLHTITRLAERSRVLIISSWEWPPSLHAAIRAGARGCVTRHAGHETVATAVAVVASGGLYLCEPLAERLCLELNRPQRADEHGLSPREAETLRWIARGYTHGQIATRMGLTRATIDTYAKRIRSKLKANNKAELTRMAIALGHLATHD